MNSEELTKDIIVVVSELNQIFFKDYCRLITFPKELNATNIKCLLILKHSKQMTMTQLSKELNLEKGSFTTVSKILFENGYIDKIKNSKDKRIFYIVLTEKGEKEAEKFLKGLEDFISSKLSNMDTDFIDDFAIYIDKIKSFLNLIKN